MPTSAYERFLNFFNSMNRERLDGLDNSYFEGMNEKEKRKSYDFLIKLFEEGSSEAVGGLQALLGPKAYDLFINRIRELRKKNAISEQRLSLSIALWQTSKDIQYQSDMLELLRHQNEFVRASALSALSLTPDTPELLKELEEVCLKESEDLIVKSAAQQLLKRHGLTPDNKNKADEFRYFYRRLKSGDMNERKLAICELRER